MTAFSNLKPLLETYCLISDGLSRSILHGDLLDLAFNLASARILDHLVGIEEISMHYEQKPLTPRCKRVPESCKTRVYFYIYALGSGPSKLVKIMEALQLLSIFKLSLIKQSYIGLQCSYGLRG